MYGHHGDQSEGDNVNSNQDDVIISTDRFTDRQILLDNVSDDSTCFFLKAELKSARRWIIY